MAGNLSITGLDPMPLECRGCLLGQAYRTAREAHLPENQRDQVVSAAMGWMASDDPEARSTLRLGRRITDLVADLSGLRKDFDIYHEPKAMSNRLAATHLDRLRAAIAQAQDRLSMAVRVSAAGNVIDFGAKDHSTLDIESELEAVTSQRFERFEIEDFRNRVLRARSILFVCDNAGEIVFDTLLMEELRRINPEAILHAAFRDAPILNDATLDDAMVVGMDSFADVISSGSRLAGTVLAECTPAFRDLFRKADLIVSKGQGNFSSLLPDADERVFFVFRTKCEPVARRSETARGTLQLVRGDHIGPVPSGDGLSTSGFAHI